MEIKGSHSSSKNLPIADAICQSLYGVVCSFHDPRKPLNCATQLAHSCLIKPCYTGHFSPQPAMQYWRQRNIASRDRYLVDVECSQLATQLRHSLSVIRQLSTFSASGVFFKDSDVKLEILHNSSLAFCDSCPVELDSLLHGHRRSSRPFDNPVSRLSVTLLSAILDFLCTHINTQFCPLAPWLQQYIAKQITVANVARCNWFCNVSKSRRLFNFFCNLLHKFLLRCKLQRRGVTCAISSTTCFAIALSCRLQRKLPRVTGPFVTV